MNSILQDLYYGGLAPQAANEGFSAHGESFSRLLKTQAPELEPSFTRLHTELSRIYIADTEEMFCQGFSLAVKLFAEALSYEL